VFSAVVSSVFIWICCQIDSFMKRGLNVHDRSDEKPQTMKREPKFVRFGAVQDA
jgi:hypothetical protein